MLQQRVTIHSSLDRGEFFFSTDHCQEHGLEGFVPGTAYLPFDIVPRPALPSGVVATVQELVMIFHSNQKEIPNPDPSYQPR